ncbi:MAG: ankyrin repeat domain-containing protein [Sphaerospermopsis sp.]|nr:ankyrin repeat domain-containing protein [Sphaerospermopsis sp.]
MNRDDKYEEFERKFFKACQNGELRKVRIMLPELANFGFCIDTRCPKGVCFSVDRYSDGNTTYGDLRGYTPLMLAAEFGHKKIAELLIAWGATLHVQCYKGETILMKAVRSGNLKLVKSLIFKNMVDGWVEKATTSSLTALKLAVYYAHYNIIKYLLHIGCDDKYFVDKIYGDKKLNKIFKNHFNNNNRGEK